MTQLTDQIQGKPINSLAAINASKLWHKQNNTVALTNQTSPDTHKTIWVVSVMGQEIGIFEAINSNETGDKFKHNPKLVYGSVLYGWHETKAEIIGILLVFWAIRTGLLDYEIFDIARENINLSSQK